MGKNYDVLIIGAGIMGVCTAFELSKRGIQVAVLEKTAIGAGSSGRSSAIIRQHYSNETTARMALHSLQVFQNFREVVGGECGFTQTGFLVLTPESDVEGLRVNIAFQQGLGIQTELLTQSEIRSRWPQFEVADIVEAAYEPESGYSDPNSTLGAFVDAGKRNGVDYRLETEVTGIRFRSGQVIGVDSSTGSFDAPVILNCAGPWGARVAEMAEVEVPIKSCRVQVSFFRRPAVHAATHPIIADFVNAVYWRDETGALTMVGLIDPEEENYVVDPDGFNESVDFDFIADSGERFVRRFPDMKDSESAGGFAALYAITPDWHPIMDELIPGSGAFICAGFSGHGFKLGPAVGRMAADMVMGEETPGMDRRMFRRSRYKENDPVRGQYEYSIVG